MVDSDGQPFKNSLLFVMTAPMRGLQEAPTPNRVRRAFRTSSPTDKGPARP